MYTVVIFVTIYTCIVQYHTSLLNNIYYTFQLYCKTWLADMSNYKISLSEHIYIYIWLYYDCYVNSQKLFEILFNEEWKERCEWMKYSIAKASCKNNVILIGVLMRNSKGKFCHDSFSCVVIVGLCELLQQPVFLWLFSKNHNLYGVAQHDQCDDLMDSGSRFTLKTYDRNGPLKTCQDSYGVVSSNFHDYSTDLTVCCSVD